MTGESVALGGLYLTTTITVLFALHQITSEKIDNLQKRQDQEAERLRENTNKTEARLGETTLRAETKMKEEADKVREQFLANNSAIKNEMDFRFGAMQKLIDSRIK
jgi:DNA-binding ferritin-like protein